MHPDKIHIDELLRQMIPTSSETDLPAYSEFLRTLDQFEATQTKIDLALTSKLQEARPEPLLSWKNTVAILWYRRMRNVGLGLFLGLGLALSFYTIREKEIQDQPALLEEGTERSETQTQAESPLSSFSNPKPSTEAIPPQKEKLESRKSHLAQPSRIGFTPFRNAPSSGFSDANVAPAASNGYKENFSINPSPLRPFTITYAGHDSLHSENKLRPELPGPIKKSGKGFTTGLVLKAFFNFSVQSYRSEMQKESGESLNRNYRELANNGKRNPLSFNYGIAIEKRISKQFGLSLGFAKTTIKQYQQSNYTLEEAPVFDIDGHIAGYIQIAPEKINTRIENRITYWSVPLLVFYQIPLKPKHGLQFSLGSSFCFPYQEKTEKLDYRSLEKIDYQNQSKKKMFNNIQMGIFYNYQFKAGYQLELGYERQSFMKVSELSDAFENIHVHLNNFSIALKYKL